MSDHPQFDMLAMQAENDRLRHDITGYDAVKRTMQAEIDRLRDALLEYGGHHPSCRRHTYPLLEPKICDCGWTEFFIKYSKEGE